MGFSIEALLRKLGLPVRETMETAAEISPTGSFLAPGTTNQDRPAGPVSVNPVPITQGSMVKVEYEGILAQHGAQQVFLHYGYGPGPWRRVSEARMLPVGNGRWAATIRAEDAGRLAFCFRDNAYHWDNNGGRDWSYEIHAGNLR